MGVELGDIGVIVCEADDGAFVRCQRRKRRKRDLDTARVQTTLWWVADAWWTAFSSTQADDTCTSRIMFRRCMVITRSPALALFDEAGHRAASRQCLELISYH